ncbi:hypothetical protein [Paraburkholderia kururiensis]|uniref:hypothetical protein n=1 Tax=Paraburkholderia kururiensis TaxID=984307 RepID=UPI0039A620A5
MQTKQFTQVEHESIVLYAAWDMLAGMVNYGFFRDFKGGVDALPMFETSNDRRLFNILLGDFLSQPKERGNTSSFFNLPEPKDGARLTDYTFLFYLRQVCEHPILGSDAEQILAPLNHLSKWLEEACFVEGVWLGTIGVAADISMPRVRYIKICGDIAKHNFSRLQSNVGKIMRTLKDAGTTISVSDGFKAIPDFYEWFHDNVFTYHCGYIAEMLNNLLWGIYRYVLPEFRRSHVKTDNTLYRFDYPPGCEHDFARSAYWQLMNCVRSKPYIPEFKVPLSCKTAY